MSNADKEGSNLKWKANVHKGDVLRDNDPRNNGRVIVICEVVGSYAIYKTDKRTCQIRLDRIYEDSKPRTRGWTVHERATTGL